MTRTSSEEKLTNTRNQYFAVMTANFLMLGNGCMLGWPVQFLPKLASVKTPLSSGPLNSHEISWIVSIGSFGSLLSLICNGFIFPLIGPKRCLLYSSIPMIVYWLLIHFATNFYYILSARFVSGWTSSTIYLTGILFCAEVANDEIRGRLTSFTFVSQNMGFLIAFIFGAFVKYEYIPYICVTIPVIFAVIFKMFPNTRRYHLAKSELEKAENALKFYKAYTGKDRLEDDAIAAEFERLQAVQKEQKTTEKLRFSDFCRRNAIKGIFIGCAMSALTHFTAYYTIINYSTFIFARSDSSLLSPYVSSIILAVALILGALVSACMADIFGRRTLIIISLIGCIIGLLSMALYHYMYLNEFDLSSFRWVPVLSLSFAIFITGAGAVPLAIVCTIENLPTKIRDVGTAIAVFMSNLILFGFLRTLPILLDSIDVHGCMIMFAILSTVAIVFVAVVLRESVGQSLDDIGANKMAKVEHANTRSSSITT